MRGMTCQRIGQFSSAGSMRLKKYGVMASASLWFASFAPANSSGVSVGLCRCYCSAVVIRFLSCQCQSFQSASETLLQKPRPADLNCFNEFEERDGGSSPFSREVSLCIVRRTINLIGKLSSERVSG